MGLLKILNNSSDNDEEPHNLCIVKDFLAELDFFTARMEAISNGVYRRTDLPNYRGAIGSYLGVVKGVVNNMSKQIEARNIHALAIKSKYQKLSELYKEFFAS